MLEFSRQQSPDPAVSAAQGERMQPWRWPLGLGKRVWSGVFQGHTIRVLTRGPLPARLYIDGRCVDRRIPLLTADTRLPLLSAQLPAARGEVMIVKVYSRGICARKIEVRISGTCLEMDPVADAA